MKRGYLDRPDCRLYYEVYGAGPVLIFAHGLGGNHLSWWQQVPHFRDRYTCVTFSHRGFAPSSAPAGGPDPADYARRSRGAGRSSRRARHPHRRAVDGRLERARIRVRASGSACARWCSPRPPARSRARRRCSPIRNRCPAGSAPRQRRRAPIRRTTSIVAGGERMAREQPALRISLSGDRRAERRSTSWAAPAADGRTAPPGRPLRTLDVPTLWLTGAEDLVYPPFLSDMLAPLMPKARVAQRAGRPVTRSISSGRRSSIGSWMRFLRANV